MVKQVISIPWIRFSDTLPPNMKEIYIKRPDKGPFDVYLGYYNARKGEFHIPERFIIFKEALLEKGYMWVFPDNIESNYHEVEGLLQGVKQC